MLVYVLVQMYDTRCVACIRFNVSDDGVIRKILYLQRDSDEERYETKFLTNQPSIQLFNTPNLAVIIMRVLILCMTSIAVTQGK